MLPDDRYVSTHASQPDRGRLPDASGSAGDEHCLGGHQVGVMVIRHESLLS
jgi:hypothetical protein